MADEALAGEIEVTNTTAKKNRGKPYPYTPLQAGLFGTIASAPAGPLAPIIGLGTALVTKLRRDTYNDEQSKFYANLDEEQAGIKRLLADESKIGTPEEQRQLKNASQMVTDGYARLAVDRNDPNGMALITKGRELISGVIGSDVEEQKKEQAAQYDMQRNLVSNTAKRYQQQFQSVLESNQNAEKIAMQIIDFVNQPDFDPNKPLNKAHLADLVSMGGLMFRDVPDAMDAISQGAGALGAFGKVGEAAGGIAQGIATYIKSEDFKVNPSDFYKFAINLKDFSAKYSKQELEQLGRQSQALDAHAKKLNILPADLSVIDFVSGGEKDLPTNPTPQLLHSTYLSPAERKRQEGMTPEGRAKQDAARRGVVKRPTN